MKIPNPELAVVTDDKLVNYLLSFSHPVGRFKAAFFAQLGIGVSEVEHLRSCLMKLTEQDSESTETTEYGQKYVIVGEIRGPSGRTADIVTVWFVPVGQEIAHLVTAYPET